MKSIIAALIVLAMAATVQAQDGWIEGTCYQYQLAGDRLVINTATQLTNEKGMIVSKLSDVEKNLNAQGKTLFKKLIEKYSDVSSVVIAARQMAVNCYPYPPNMWAEDGLLLPQVLEELDAVLCDK